LTSEVILLSDASHAIPVQINRNGLRTIAVGTGDMAHLKLPYLSTSADVVAGDLLVTSGLGGGFPAGYPVGTVTEVKRDPAQSLAEVDVRPAAALDRSRELMFVWLKPAAVATATGTAAATGTASGTGTGTASGTGTATVSAQATKAPAKLATRTAAGPGAKAPAAAAAKAPSATPPPPQPGATPP
jgi:rod shape-determining protein MreC